MNFFRTLGAKTLDFLQELGKTTLFLFAVLARSGALLPRLRLGIRQIQNRLRDWAVKNGSPQHLSPHMMRHSYASHLLQSSGDIRAIQELLGHSNLSATQIYTKLDFDRLAQVYDRAHPRAKRKKDGG